MERQAVVIFPEGRLAGVEAFRRRWDPLGRSVPAHITVVFPVSRPRREESLAPELATLLEDFPRFSVTLSEARVWEREYLFLVASRGGEQVTRLHSALYDGPFRHARRPAQFVPHMTIGRCSDPAQLAAAAAAAAGSGLQVDAVAAAVSVYRISDTGQRTRTLDVPLSTDD